MARKFIERERERTASNFFVSLFFQSKYIPFSFLSHVRKQQQKVLKIACTFIFFAHFNGKHLKIKMRILDLGLAEKQTNTAQTTKKERKRDRNKY